MVIFLSPKLAEQFMKPAAQDVLVTRLQARSKAIGADGGREVELSDVEYAWVTQRAAPYRWRDAGHVAAKALVTAEQQGQVAF